MITCFVQYELDPAKIEDFKTYARMWVPLVEKFVGTHHGYYLPNKDSDNLAVCLFSFPSIADYEAYCSKRSGDKKCQVAYEFADSTHCIRRFDHHLLRPLDLFKEQI